ncbi:MAG TPA: sugar-binding protein [Polyangiales bacterium]
MSSHPRLRLVLCSLLATGACGYVGYETDRGDAGAGVDLDAATELDAAQELDADTSDADEQPRDAEPDDATSEDASTEDADMDAAELDGGAADASDLDGGADADAMDADTLDAGLDAEEPDADAAPVDAGQDARQATQVSDYCVQIPALPDEPVIDGVVDGALALVTLTPVDWTNTAVPLPGHTTATYALAYRPNGLYAYMRVRDPNRAPPAVGEYIWRGDGVELYVDDDGASAMQHAYDNPGAIQIIVAAPENDTTASTRATRFRDTADLGAWSSTRFAAFPSQDGYVLEAFVEASALDLASWSLATGGRVGMDLGVNVSVVHEADAGNDAGIPVEGQRLGQYFLRIGTGDNCGGRPFCTPDAFCTPTLVD